MNLKIEDYFQTGKRSLIRFKEKGGKEKEIPVHHKLEEILDIPQSLKAAGKTGSALVPNDAWQKPGAWIPANDKV